MKMHGLLFVRALPPLVVAATVGVLVWAGCRTADAAFTTALSSALVTVSGVVSGTPEGVQFSGSAKIDSKMVTDPDFGGPSNVVLSIDLSGVSGTGVLSKTKYVTPSRKVVIRPLVPSDRLDISFPFYPSAAKQTSAARLGKASFVLAFNTSTGKLSGATATVTGP